MLSRDKKGLVTVIVTHNPMKWIDRVYSFLKEENILNNTIIVDNGSSDGFADWVSSKNLYGLVYFQKKNLGFGAANNIGIELALEKNAKHILLLNQDAWLEKKSLDLMLEVLIRNKEIGIVSPLHFNKNLTKLDFNFRDYLRSSETVEYFQELQKSDYSCIETEFVNAAIWLMSVDVIKKVGGFNPSFYHYGEDDEYCSRLKKRGFRIVIAPKSIGVHDREFRSKKITRKLAIHNGINSAKIYFFKTEKKYSFIRTILITLLNRGRLKADLFIRLAVCLNLVLLRRSLLNNKKIADSFVAPFINEISDKNG